MPVPKATGTTKAPAFRTFVLDTSVLLSDPRAMLRFKEHEVVLPVVVVTELEAKRHHPELGYFARQALRLLDDLRISEGRLDAPVSVGDDGGTLRVELNHTDPSSLPAGFRLGDNDTRILSVAKNLSDEGFAVTVVSKDLPMRVKASAVGLEAEEYRAELAVDSGWTGMAELDVTVEEMDALYEHGRVENATVANKDGERAVPTLLRLSAVATGDLFAAERMLVSLDGASWLLRHLREIGSAVVKDDYAEFDVASLSAGDADAFDERVPRARTEARAASCG